MKFPACCVVVLCFLSVANAEHLLFSPAPQAAEFFRARVFDEPLISTGEPAPSENRALAEALTSYSERSNPDNFSAITSFLQRYPKSPWRGSVLTGLGIEYYNTAHYSKAIEAWQEAWSLLKDATEPTVKRTADRAAGELAYMYARLGRMQELGALLKTVEGRTFVGPATEKISGAREALWNMEHHPETSFRCGPLALHRIQALKNPTAETDIAIHKSASSQRGMSLPQVAEISKQIGLNFQMAFRERGGAFVVPSVVHWKAGHYAAMTKQEGDRYLMQDPTFGNDVWATSDALESETSGYFLVPSGPLPKGWRAVDAEEGKNIWGKGVTSSNNPKNTTPRDPKSAPSPCKGMATSSVHLMLVNLNISDEPVGYVPPVGPAVRFTLRYNHREAFQPATFTYANFGPKWTCDWISYINDNPQSPSADVNYYVRGGGVRTHTGFNTNTQTFVPQAYEQTRLTRTGPANYEMLASDGSKMIFGRSDGATGTSRKIFLTQVIDAFGNTVTLNYDANLRLTNIVDAIGQATTLSYSNAADSFKITRVTDPFGRFASFDYDSSGRLTNITDVIGITSRFTYESTGDFIAALTTPYGTTSFTRGGSGTTRWLETLYPDGSKERVEFNQDTNLGIGFSEPPEFVPRGMSNTFNQFLYARNTYYWSRTACATAYGDYTKAKIYHWLHEVDLSATSGILESIKEPLEGRVWFDYPGQSSSLSVGTSDKPLHAGRVLDDGSTQLYTYSYNEFGHVTNSIDPVGRTLSYLYDTNGIDLLEVRMTRAGKNELLYKATYNAQHLPLTIAREDGEVTTNSYNARGQLLTRTDAKGQTTTYSYDTNGYRLAVDGPLPGTNDTTHATYDTVGRLRTKTDQSNYTLTFSYDALDRITNIAFPDSTSYQMVYNRLDVSSVKDRAGRQSFFEYDPMRNMNKRVDPLGRVTQFQWCRCGAIKSLTDPLGRTTEWQTDVQSRLTAKQYSDGSKITYLYENRTSRPRQIIDEKLQIKRFAYNVDNTLQSISYTNNAVFTPPVTITYDPDYNRKASMTDGLGTTIYNYYPVINAPSPGAGKLATIDGPYANDTITYIYDELGRRVITAIDGVAATVTYDASGRMLGETNALGVFSYGYDGTSRRRVSENFPNGLTRVLAYDSANQDFDLHEITHQIGGTPVSDFVYQRDNAKDVITTWSQQAGAAAADLYSFNYDSADRLMGASVTNSGAQITAFDYTYDAADNLLNEVAGTTTNTATYNVLNQLSTSTAPNASRTNEWDAEDRLAATVSGNERVEFSYSGEGHLAAIRRLTNGVQASLRRLLWCNRAICQERDASGAAVTRRFYPQGMKVETGAAAGNYFYTRDHLNSVRELVDNAGNVRARYSYDPYGRRTKVSGDVDADFGFAGMFWSAEAGLYHTWFRVYDPQLTRWLSRDPLKNAESQEGPNLYSYAKLNPINGADRLGLCCEKEKQILEDLEDAVFNICMEINLSADRTCAMMDAHPDDPWKYTCGSVQRNASKLCEEAEQKYSSSIAALAANYFTCLAKGCRQTAPCPTPKPDLSSDNCTEDGTCSVSAGRPAERSAFGTPAHNDFLPSMY